MLQPSLSPAYPVALASPRPSGFKPMILSAQSPTDHTHRGLSGRTALCKSHLVSQGHSPCQCRQVSLSLTRSCRLLASCPLRHTPHAASSDSFLLIQREGHCAFSFVQLPSSRCEPRDRKCELGTQLGTHAQSRWDTRHLLRAPLNNHRRNASCQPAHFREGKEDTPSDISQS